MALGLSVGGWLLVSNSGVVPATLQGNAYLEAPLFTVSSACTLTSLPASIYLLSTYTSLYSTSFQGLSVQGDDRCKSLYGLRMLSSALRICKANSEVGMSGKCNFEGNEDIEDLQCSKSLPTYIKYLPRYLQIGKGAGTS